MNHAPRLSAELALSQIMAGNFPLMKERHWSTLSGNSAFDGSVIALDEHPDELESVEDAVTRTMDGEFHRVVVWVPREKRQPGRITPSLRCGYTVFRHAGRLVAFQSVVIVPMQAVGELADIGTGPFAGQFLMVPVEYVSAWDGTGIGEVPSTRLS